MSKAQFWILNLVGGVGALWVLLQLARTNAAAAGIVREFKIQWTPGPQAPFASVPTNRAPSAR